jgi:uncharacterized membrane protein YdjX (TVP38/TMEM64 family)
MNKKVVAWLLGILAVVIILVGLYFIFQPDLGNFWRIFTSFEAFREFVSSFGIFAPLIFFLIQVFQVVFSFIPGNVTAIAGGLLFGFLPGFFLSFFGLVVGSILAFFLARWLGQKFVVKIVGQKNFDKYSEKLSNRYFLILAILFLIPFTPDDVVCFLAGLTRVPFLYFLVLLLFRLPGTFFTVLIGSGVLELNVWQWVVFIGISLILIVVFLKHGDKVDTLFQKKLDKVEKGS